MAELAGYRAELARWREALIARLKDRPEGFTDGRKLIAGGSIRTFWKAGRGLAPRMFM